MTGLGDAIRGWAPAARTATDTLHREPVDALAALLDQPPPDGDLLPPLWHWLFFADHPRTDELGPDGHPAHDPFLPPVPHRRRMFAGGRLELRRPLTIGDTVHRTSRITHAVPKAGRRGELLFVTEAREYADADGVALVEEQDIVYRQAPPEPPDQPDPPEHPGTDVPRTPGDGAAGLPVGRVGLVPDPVLLFRFSALTANAHRIHYDEPYARTVEGHPGLVVHGPLLALLLLEPARRAGHGAEVAAFTFRLRRPAVAGIPVVVATEPELSAGPVGGEAAVTGTLTWR